MSAPNTWDLGAAISALTPVPWKSDAWRNHSRRYEATDVGGARLMSGRYNCAPDRFPSGPCWPVLYLSLSNGGAIAELTRWLEPTDLAVLNNRRLSRLRVILSRVLDLRDPGVIGLTVAQLTDDHDYTITQAIAGAALHQGIEGLIVPAASLVSSNLIVLVDNLLPTSSTVVLDSVDPKLHVQRTS